MRRNAPQEPTRIFESTSGLCHDFDSGSGLLGCHGCPDKDVCGGLHLTGEVMSCMDYCTCQDKSRCDMVCRNKPDAFLQRMQEVKGVELYNVQRVVNPPISPILPDVVPLIGHKYKRRSNLGADAVAVPLYELFNLATGEPLVRNRKDISDRFRVSEQAIIIATGVDRDFKLEAWWALPNRKGLIQHLRTAGVSLITTPNFSLFNDVPRLDNLYSIKRIALCWAELLEAGMPAALHLNARTDFDYERWLCFIEARPEVESVAFEFGTGAGYANRIDWHVNQLCRIARQVSRPLTLIVRGGTHVIDRLKNSFNKVVLIESDAFSRTLRRRRAVISELGRLRWVKAPTPPDALLDELLLHNIRVVNLARTSTDRRVIDRRELAMRMSRRASRSNSQPIQIGNACQLNLPLERRAVPTNGQGIIPTSKTKLSVMIDEGSKQASDSETVT